MVPELEHIVEISIKITTEAGEIITTEVVAGIIDPVTKMVIGITIDQVTEGMMVIKDMVIETKITIDLGTEIGGIGVAPGKVPNLGAVPKTDTKVEGGVEMIIRIGTGLNLDLDPHLM